MTTFDFAPLTIDLALAGAALIVFVSDLLLPRLRPYVGHLTGSLLVGLVALSLFVDTSGTTAWGAYVGGDASSFFKQIVLLAAALGVWGGLGHVRSSTPLRQGEYYFLLLLSVLGMTLLPGARDLLLLVVCFELMGLPLYVLAAFAKTDSATTGSGGAGRVRGAAAEAGLKLYLVGAGSTALMLFGLSLVTGLAGGTGLSLLGAAPHGPLLVLGMILLLAGMSFKLGVAPFHMWVPDTYQGAGTPFVAVLSAAPKAAGVAAVALIFIGGLPAQQAIWAPLLVALCVVTLSVGTLLALSQTNIKRLLAYSGVAHAGFMLMALATGTELGLQMLLFYLLSYVLTNVGSFLVVHAVAVSDGSDDSAQSFDGLAQRSPWLACAWLLFLLSLAGIPFVSGFWAKTYVFIAAYRAGMLWLVALGALLSVLALFYYLQLAKAAYVSDPTTTRPVRVSVSLRAAIVFCLVGVVGIGVWPAPFLEAARRAAVPFFDAKALALAEAERASTAPRVHPRHVFVSETTLILARPAAARTEITSEGALDEEP